MNIVYACARNDRLRLSSTTWARKGIVASSNGKRLIDNYFPTYAWSGAFFMGELRPRDYTYIFSLLHLERIYVQV